MSQDIRCTEGNVVACVPDDPDSAPQGGVCKLPGSDGRGCGERKKPDTWKQGVDKYSAGEGYTLGSLVGSTQHTSKNVWSHDISNTAHDGFEVGNNYTPPQSSNLVPMYNDGDRPDRGDRGAKGDKGDAGDKGGKVGSDNGSGNGSFRDIEFHINIGGCSGPEKAPKDPYGKP